MNLELKNKAVIVTGGSKGIGRGVVSGLLNEGACVAVYARNEENFKELYESRQCFEYCKVCRT